MADSLFFGLVSPRSDRSASCSSHCSLGTRRKKSRTGCPAFLSKFIVIVVKRIELKPTDIDVKFEDVLYYRVHEGTNKVDLKYNTMTNYSIPMDEFKIYQQEHTGFLKGLIWYYEKETRLLIKLRGAVADSIRNRVKDIERGEIKYKIELSLETIYPKIIIDFGPEMDSLDDCWHLTSGKEFNGIRDFIYSTSRTHLSSYKGTIKMNLCQKCDKR